MVLAWASSAFQAAARFLVVTGSPPRRVLAARRSRLHDCLLPVTAAWPPVLRGSMPAAANRGGTGSQSPLRLALSSSVDGTPGVRLAPRAHRPSSGPAAHRGRR